MPAVCQSLVKANLYTTVGVVILNALNIGAGLAAQCLSKDTVFICQICTGVGVLHVVAPAVHGGSCCASYALHYQGFVIAVVNFLPVNAVLIILAYAVCIPVQLADILTCAGGCQAFGNLYLSTQVSTVRFMILIGNLLCQCCQSCFNSTLIIHGNTAVVGRQDYAGALVSLSDNGIASRVVCNICACIFMLVDNSFPTAVMSDI